ncbi:MAG TPA: BREX system ATP-binding domain-containing protein, partial [Candidatus Limnocylindria bacterium]|nr:BREX system ATP-binding domain-containing protein [Candidatus Limnocylindria bacterium]
MTITDERRLVTVLFADLVGFTGHAENADPEQVRDFQRAYFGAVTREVERFGGTLEKYIGDAAMAIFGAPTAHDDDAERALRSALAIREAVGKLDGGGHQVRIGVNTGEVVGGLGGPNANDYTVSGDAVNVAARLQQTAQPDEILVGGMTRRLSADAFAFAPLDPTALKGRAETVEAWRLERELPDRPRMHGGEARLVGRERELNQLESALEEARDGRGLMVALVGEAGIGKSRLALEMRHRAEANGFATAWTTSRSYASAFPYHLVSQLITQLLDRPDDATTVESLTAAGVTAEQEKLDRYAAVIDDATGEGRDDDPHLADLSPSGRQRILVHALGALLEAASSRGPMLVVLDDLHWADPASLAVVEELLGQVPELRVVLLATYRSNWSHGWEGRSAYEQLNLRPLRTEDARLMVAEMASGGDLDSDLAERVLERSAGNPLFLETLLHGERAAASGGKEHKLPATIHEMLLARLDALPAPSRRTLQLASVVGMEFSEDAVAALSDDGDGMDLEETLKELQRAELIASGGATHGWTVRHPLIHEVAYGSLLVSTRRGLHARIGQWLEAHGGEELLPELARHYRDSDDLAKAREYLPAAGRHASALNATRESYGWFMDAAAVFTDEPIRRAEMLEAAARQTHLIGNIPEALKLQEEAIATFESVGAMREALTARTWLGRFIWLLGDPAGADRQIRMAIEGLEKLGPSAELAQAYSFHSQSLMLVPDYDRAIPMARKAIEIAEPLGANVVLVHAYNNLGCSLLNQSHREGLDYLLRSRDLAEEHHLPDDVGRAYANLTGQGGRIFPYESAQSEAYLLEGIEYSQRTVPDGIFDRWLRSAWGEFLLVSGRWTESEQVLNRLSLLLAEAYLRSEVRSLQALLLAYRGRFSEAATIMGDSAETAERIGDLQAVMPAELSEAVVRAGLADDAEAVAALRRAIDRRGTNPEPIISSWFLFEGTDVMTAIARRAPSSPDLRAGVELLSSFAARLAPDSAQPGDLTHVEVRQALFALAVDQLTRLAGQRGLPAPGPFEGFPGREDAFAILERERRPFDVARAQLWLAEEGV